MSINPKFSIVIPVYNVEEYLGRCLESILQQTLIDFEVICVDDGSTDKSFSILELYASKDTRFKVIKQENRGVSAARNTGLENANGMYICFADPDDYIATNFLERIYDEILEHNPDIIVFGANVFPITTDTDPWVCSDLTNSYAIYNKFHSDILLSGNRGYPFVWRNCFRRKFLKKYHLKFDEYLVLGEDTVFQVSAFAVAKKMVFLPDKLYFYRNARKGSAMEKAKNDILKRLYQHIYVLEKIAVFWEVNHCLSKYKDTFALFAIDFMGMEMLNYKMSERKKIINKFFSLWCKYDIRYKADYKYRQYNLMYYRLKFISRQII